MTGCEAKASQPVFVSISCWQGSYSMDEPPVTIQQASEATVSAPV